MISVCKFLDTQEDRLKFLQQPENNKITTGVMDLPFPEVETDEEWEVKAKVQYEEYLAFEKYWLKELGLVTDVA